jgi:hypothetical protein
MKIVINTYTEGPFVLLVEPRKGVLDKEDAKDAFIVGERKVMSQTIVCFETKERALEVAKQYWNNEEGYTSGTITVMSIRDAGFLKRFMSF